MNKKISQFEVTNKLESQDLLTIVQDGNNKNITTNILKTSISDTFATNERVDLIEEDIIVLDTKVNDNYSDLSNKIVTGDANVKSEVTNTVNEYQSVLSGSITDLEKKHDKDMINVNNTVQDWADDIDKRSTKEQLHNALDRLTIAEDTITALAELIANGGGSGSAPGYHTQPTNTILPLQGYYNVGDTSKLSTTDTLNQALSKLENQIEAGISSSSGSLPAIRSDQADTPSDQNIYTAKAVYDRYLRRDRDDSANGYIKFQKGLQGGNVFGPKESFMGVGASLYPVGDKWNFDVDNLFVRGRLTVNELIVNEIKATGGEILVSQADMKCIAVERVDNNGNISSEYDADYKCYFDTEDDTKYNQFRAGDQAICQVFDGKNVKRYWRLVKEAGRDFIILSFSVCESGSSEPEEGDGILQLGNRYPDEESRKRRSAIFISAQTKADNEGPNITFYDNIDDFSLVNKSRTSIGKNSVFVGTIMQTTNTGDLVRVPRDLGAYIVGTTYYYYDRVSYNGSLWLCMVSSTSNAPVKGNEEWLEQVSKGDQGAAGADKAKWVEVIGDRLFMYNNPEFSGTPTPERITLVCKSYNLDNPTYEWTAIGSNLVMSTNSTMEVRHEQMIDRTLRLRCTVKDGLETFYDETQLAKLGDGAKGSDAYYIDLSNGSMSVPYDASGNNPMISLTGVYTYVYAYYGIEPRTIQQINATVKEGIAEVTIDGDKVTLTKLGSASARIILNVAVDNQVFTKDLWINKVTNGQDGFDGVDAAYVMLSGEQFFTYDQNTKVTSPSSITLTASQYNMSNSTYKWEWSVSGAYSWSVISGQTSSTLVVRPNDVYFNNNVNEVTFRVTIEIPGGSTYTDMITINKISNGKDGENVYRAALTNEATTVPSDYAGTVYSSDYNKARTKYTLRYGTKTMTSSEYTTSYTVVTGNSSLNSLSKSGEEYYVSTMSNSDDTVIFRIDFKVNNVSVDTVDFTVTKAKGGKPADYEYSVYCLKEKGITPLAPSKNDISTRIIEGSYKVSNGSKWYGSPQYSSSDSTWTSKAELDGVTGLIKSSAWSAPVKVSGVDGAKGDKGDTGSRGPAGEVGEQGLRGPGLNFRGAYKSDVVYCFNNNYRDVVYYDNGATIRGYFGVRYYGCLETGTSPTSTNHWEAFNSFENVATGLLFAQEATIANWKFSNQIIWGLDNGVYLDGRGGQKGTPVFCTGPSVVSNGNPSVSGALKIYAGGTLTVGSESDGVSNAGITGNGASSGSVRFWAGSTFSGRDTAPFRVYQNGDVACNNANLTGTFSTSSSGARIVISTSGQISEISSYNGSSYLTGKYDCNFSDSFGGSGRWMIYARDTSGTVTSQAAVTGLTLSVSSKISGGNTLGITASGKVVTLSCNNWPDASLVTPGCVYKDSNGFLKVK